MRDGAFIATAVVGAVIAVLCCATPWLVLTLGAAGVAGWLATADYVLIPAAILSLGLIGLWLYRCRHG